MSFDQKVNLTKEATEKNLQVQPTSCGNLHYRGFFIRKIPAKFNLTNYEVSNPFLTRGCDTLDEICTYIDISISHIEWTSEVNIDPYLRLSEGVYKSFSGQVFHGYRVGPSNLIRLEIGLLSIIQYSSGIYYENKSLFTRSYRGYTDRMKSVVDYDQLAVF